MASWVGGDEIGGGSGVEINSAQTAVSVRAFFSVQLYTK